MKKISVWARKNRSSARILIVLLNIVLVILAIQMRGLLAVTNIHPAPLAFLVVLLIFTAVIFLYPQRFGPWTMQSKNSIYRIQKSCDFILAFCSFLMICFFPGNASDTGEKKLSFPFLNTLSASNGAKPTSDEILQSLHYRSRKDLSRSEKKILKHEFFKLSKEYVIEKAKGNDLIAAKIFLTICTLVAAVGVGFLVAGLACSLSCSGMDGLALLVTLFGLGGIIYGSIKLIQAISHISGKKQAPVLTP